MGKRPGGDKAMEKSRPQNPSLGKTGGKTRLWPKRQRKTQNLGQNKHPAAKTFRQRLQKIRAK
jgi:hypothetical protein